MRAPCLLCTVLALACGAAAQAGWRAAAYLGGAVNHGSWLRVEQPARGTRFELRGVSYEGRSLEPPVYYGYRLGYFFGRFGVEAEFVHQKIYARAERVVEAQGTLHGAPVAGRLPMQQIVEQFSISHGLNLLLANVVWERPMGARSFLQLRFGAGPTIPHAESLLQGEGRQGYQLGRPAAQAAAGLEIRLWRALHLLGEYKFTHTRQRVKIAAGHAETLVRSHHGVFGVGLRF
ncbi:MAG: outer membrane beta-barrel protein [Bryobacterales bacterium]|nr:outer membrane beta-barrel protein [Bryobacteraceae bacterium]MDW8131661.1 outer membrane beta-barrel protein [Bryobacterales bacterium]